EGRALMCLAEALLRIPDVATRDALIRDKISQGDWRSYVASSQPWLVNAANWGLVLIERLVDPPHKDDFPAVVTRLLGRGGEPFIRKAAEVGMRLLGGHFIAGETIAAALAHARR